MANKYGYYMPLAANTFDSVRFLDITQKIDLLDGGERTQRKNKDGAPMWVVSALVKFQGSPPETENFTLVAPNEVASKYAQIAELAEIKLIGLAGGKWSRTTSDQTAWSFQITGIEVVKQ